MTKMLYNPLLMELAKANSGLTKAAFIPAGQAGGDPSQGGAPPPGGDPSQGGAPPPGMAPPGMGGDPAGTAPGASPSPPPGDPAAAGGAPPPGAPGGSLPNEIVGLITQTIQQQMAAGGGQAGGAGGPKKSKGGDELALQMYKMNVFLMAIITGLNKADIRIEIPPEAMLGPPPGSDPAMAAQQGAAVQPGQPGVAQPGADPNAAAGGQPPQQQPMPFAPALQPKTAAQLAEDLASEEELLAMGMPISKEAVANSPIPQGIQEMFGTAPETDAPPAMSVTQKASATLELIAAARRNRLDQ